MLSELLFWGAVALLAYLYVGYPALLRAWAALRPAPPPPARHYRPRVTLVIAAHDEAARLGQRLANLENLDYPADRLEILVGSDGSTDASVDIARDHEAHGVRVFAFERRRGKVAVLNDLVARAHGDIVVLADVRQRFEAGTLRALVAPFADPSVGAVSGELILTSDDHGRSVGDGVGFYWRYEKMIRRSESRVDSTVGATGAIYAIRRKLFRPVPTDTILDDVIVPVRIVRKGYRVLFEPAARAYDHAPTSAREELTRKARTIAGNFQLFSRERWLLDPGRNRLWLQTVSHKGLRLLTPVLHAAALAGNVGLAGQAPYAWLLVGHVLFYAAAAGGFALRNTSRRVLPLTVPYVVCLLIWATILGFARFVADRQPVTWAPAAPGRPLTEPPPVSTRSRHW